MSVSSIWFTSVVSYEKAEKALPYSPQIKSAVVKSWQLSSALSFTSCTFFSNGAGSQFKNRFSLSGILKPSMMQQDLREIDWSFFGTAHSKHPVDGVDDTVKHAARRWIFQKQVVLSSAEEFAKAPASATR